MAFKTLDPLRMVGCLVTQKFDAAMVGGFHLMSDAFHRQVEVFDDLVFPSRIGVVELADLLHQQADIFLCRRRSGIVVRHARRLPGGLRADKKKSGAVIRWLVCHHRFFGERSVQPVQDCLTRDKNPSSLAKRGESRRWPAGH